jgi:hypothetical protein
MNEQTIAQLLQYWADAMTDSANGLEQFTAEYQAWLDGAGSLQVLRRIGEEVNAANQELLARFVQLEGSIDSELEEGMYLDTVFQLEAAHTIFSNALMVAA